MKQRDSHLIGQVSALAHWCPSLKGRLEDIQLSWMRNSEWVSVTFTPPSPSLGCDVWTGVRFTMFRHSDVSHVDYVGLDWLFSLIANRKPHKINVFFCFFFINGSRETEECPLLDHKKKKKNSRPKAGRRPEIFNIIVTLTFNFEIVSTKLFKCSSFRLIDILGINRCYFWANFLLATVVPRCIVVRALSALQIFNILNVFLR